MAFNCGRVITRTTGWHKFVFDYHSGTKVDLYIDGGLVGTSTSYTSLRALSARKSTGNKKKKKR